MVISLFGKVSSIRARGRSASGVKLLDKTGDIHSEPHSEGMNIPINSKLAAIPSAAANPAIRLYSQASKGT
jgi:hypothetical protein